MIGKIVAFGAAGALALGALAGTAAAQPNGNGNAYGHTIKDECHASYGQLVKAINPASGSTHPWAGAVGAKVFRFTIPEVHCPGNGNG